MTKDDLCFWEHQGTKKTTASCLQEVTGNSDLCIGVC